MLEEIVFLIWDRKLVEPAVNLKGSMGAEGTAIHIWARDEANENDVRDGGKRAGSGEGKAPGTDGWKEEGRETAHGDGGEGDGRGEKGTDAERKKRGGRENGRAKDGRGPRCLEEYSKENTLFVTDKGILLQELKRQGRYAIALLHEGNGEEDFSGVSYAVTDIGELTMESFDKAYCRMAGLPWNILETERCIVRETTVADVDEFYRIYAEPSITRYMDRLYDTPEEERAYMQEYIKKIYGFYGYGMWSIVQKGMGRVIGRAGLSWREGFGLPEIGFMIEAPNQRRGYAYEVCRAVMEYGMGELGFEKIQALVEPGNEASAALCRKLGMEWEDRVEDGGKEYDRFIGRRVI